MSERVKKILKTPKLLFFTLGHRELLNFIPDEKYIKIGYKIKFGKELNLDNPQTFSEKLQWLKLYDRNPLYTSLVDKAEVKDYVKEILGEEYIIPTLGVYEKFEDINFDELPDQFVIKCTHDSGGLVICKDKSKLDIKKARKKINTCLRHNFFWGQREWPYKNLKPRIIIEKYMADDSGTDLKDYKFFCFSGTPRYMFIASDRASKTEETKFDFFDMEFHHLPFTNGHPNSNKKIVCPPSFEKMKELSKVLSKGIPHVRVDFYDINGKIYFGEMTFFHWSGFVPFDPPEWDLKFGEQLILPQRDEV